MKKFTSYTDESGQVENGRDFIVVTVIIDSDDVNKIEKELLIIEKESKKNEKWTNSNVTKRISYTKLLLERKMFKNMKAYFMIYRNKEDYVHLVSSQVVKAILSYANNENYEAKIFLDKVNNRIHESIRKEIRRYKIRYKKIRSIKDDINSILRLSDALCGLIRDMKNKRIDKSYKEIFEKLEKI